MQDIHRFELIIIDMQSDFVLPSLPVHVAGAQATISSVQKQQKFVVMAHDDRLSADGPYFLPLEQAYDRISPPSPLDHLNSAEKTQPMTLVTGFSSFQIREACHYVDECRLIIAIAHMTIRFSSERDVTRQLS
jgi:nicotinamidase-related amidase